jgi:Flp pilus assembly protein TadD
MVLGGNDLTPEAEEVFRRAVELAPSDERYSFNLGLVLARLGRVEEARSFFRKSLENSPHFKPARAELEKLERR